MSEQEQGATSAFGTTPEGTPEPDFLSDYEETPEPQVAETEPEQPEVPGPEATPDKEPEEPETPEEPPGPVAASDHLLPADLIEVLGGRFEGKTVADFVAAYRNAESWSNRTSQEAAEFRKQLESVQQQHSAERQKLAPLLQWVNQQIEAGELDPQELARFAPQQAPPQEQAVDPVAQAQQQAAIQAFSGAHPDAVTDPAVDAAMTRVIRTFRFDAETGTEDESEFPITAENLEIAYQLVREPAVERAAHDLQFIPSDEDDLKLLRDAVTDPGLYQQLRANPNYLESAEGHSLARRQAQVLSGYTSAEQRAPAAAQAQTEEMKRRAHVERGGSGAPAQAAPGKVAPEDMDADQLWDAVVQRAQDDRKSIFR